MSDEQMQDKDGPQPRHVTNRAYESLIDQQIREAEAAGAFRNLQGAGKPLDLDADRNVPEELRAAFRLLKSNGYAPPWIELQQRIHEERADLEVWLARANTRWPALGPSDRAALRAEHERRIGELNKQISVYNLTAPPAAGQFALLQPWRELRKLGESGSGGERESGRAGEGS